MSAYDPHRWTSHLFDIEGSMIREILGRVSLCVAWSAIVVSLYKFGPPMFRSFTIPETAHALLGPSLGLLLVFRTNSSYDRYWEGRKQWGSIINESRNLARQSEIWLAGDRRLVDRIIRWTVAYGFATMHRLRSESSLGDVPLGLPEDEVQAVAHAEHVPLAVARKITSITHHAQMEGLIDTTQRRSMDDNVQVLVDCCGACERIRSTPAPYAYVVHLRRALIVYCLTLPLALVERYEWETILVTLMTAYILFGIEEIGVEIENPFSYTINDLPLDGLCATIRRDLTGILDKPTDKVAL